MIDKHHNILLPKMIINSFIDQLLSNIIQNFVLIIELFYEFHKITLLILCLQKRRNFKIAYN